MTMSDEELIAKGRSVLLHEANSVKHLADSLDLSFAQAVLTVAKCNGRVVVVGLGKSGHVGRKLAASLSSLGTPSFFLHAVEAVHGDLGMLRAGDVVVLISHSGETIEVAALVDVVRALGCTIVTITGRAGCRLAQDADIALVTHVSEEADPLNLAPTSSSTATLALGDALAVAAATLKGFSRDNFRILHPGGALGARLRKSQESQPS